jgi:CBS domain-containing protein
MTYSRRVGSRGDEFLGAFADIERYMKLALGRRSGRFMDIARDYVAANNLPLPYLSALQMYASLRNAIDHNSHRGSYPIAEPIPDLVDEIKRLRALIRTPPKAIGVLPEMEVCSVDLSDPLSAALEHVRRFDFSQLPVYDGNRYFGILTSNTIARWLAAEIDDSPGQHRDAPVHEVLNFREQGDCAVLVTPTLTVPDAIHQLAHGGPDGVPANALIVTQNGRETDRPMRVIVVYDLPELSAALKFD